MKKGVLLINLGTPLSPSKKDVLFYLREFLSDKRVINLPFLLRMTLLYSVILPFRTAKSSKAYQAIWQKEGSPLLTHSLKQKEKLATVLGEKYHVILAMRYGSPSIQEGLAQLGSVDELIILPLFPQYSSAATGSAIEKTLKQLQNLNVFPNISLIRDFYQEPFFINAQANIIQQHLKEEDFLLLSYHGLPESHIIQSGCQSVCESACPTSFTNSSCYRAQCYQTSLSIAQALNLTPERYQTSFQSRLGKTPWIKPYTDDTLETLAQKGIKNLAIACPAFVADCLETLEEIGIEAQKQWQALGGNSFQLIPCINSDDFFIKGLAETIKQL